LQVWQAKDLPAHFSDVWQGKDLAEIAGCDDSGRLEEYSKSEKRVWVFLPGRLDGLGEADLPFDRRRRTQGRQAHFSDVWQGKDLGEIDGCDDSGRLEEYSKSEKRVWVFLLGHLDGLGEADLPFDRRRRTQGGQACFSDVWQGKDLGEIGLRVGEWRVVVEALAEYSYAIVLHG
jgi:hypothetical protein